MANRTVSVELQAKVAGYVAGVKEAETATEGLDKKLTDVGQHGKDFAEAEKSAAGLAAAIKAPTAAAGDLADKVDHAGTQMKETAVDARFLASELAKARNAALEAAAAFAVTGDKAKLTEFRKQTTYAGQLGRVDKALLSKAEQAGAQIGKAVESGVESGAGSIWETIGSFLLNPVGLAATLAAVALVGGEIGGVAGGAIVAGIGVAGIGAGVAASLNDPRVKAAERGLKSSFAELAAGIGSDFAGPTTDAIHILRAEVDHLRPSIRSTLNELAPMTTVLAQGAASGLDVFWQHLSVALLNSKPLIEWTARELPKLADDVGGLFEEMSKHTDEAQFALDSFFGIVRVGIGTLEVFTKVGATAIGAVQGLQEAASKIPVVGSAFSRAHGELHVISNTITDQTVPDLAALAQQLSKTATTADTLAGAMADKLFSSLLLADHATLSLAESQTRLTEELKANGRALDIHTKKGQANREAILSVVEANIRIYDSMIRSGYSADQAAAAYDKNTAALVKQLRDAHFTQKQIDDLIGSYAKVPDQVNTDIAVNGLVNALNNLGNLLAKINGLNGKDFGFTITEHIRHVDDGSSGSHHDYAQGGFWSGRAAADGMYLAPSDPGTILAGEPQTRGEWLIPQAGISQQRAEYLVGQAAAAHGLSLARSVPAMGGGWGGLATPAGGPDNSVHLTVQAMKANLDYTELQGWQRSAEIRQRVGRPR